MMQYQYTGQISDMADLVQWRVRANPREFSLWLLLTYGMIPLSIAFFFLLVDRTDGLVVLAALELALLWRHRFRPRRAMIRSAVHRFHKQLTPTLRTLLTAPVQVKVDEEGVRRESGYSATFWRWEIVDQVRLIDTGILFTLGSGDSASLMHIPRRAFESPEQMEELHAWCAERSRRPADPPFASRALPAD